MSATTTALVHRDTKGQSKLETVSYGPLQPDEALVEVSATGVCHTDLSCMNGVLPAPLPCVFGHEGGGIVLETGAEVTTVSKGDKVLLSFASCGDCDQCNSGHPSYCYTWAQRNFSGKRMNQSTAIAGEDGSLCHSTFFGQSCFMKKAVVHRSSIVKVPADLDLDLFASLGCGLMTGAGCVLNTLDVKKDTTLAVFGCGSVGMAAVMAGKIRGAKKIIAIDLQEDRLALAKQLGATDLVNGKADDVVQQIQKLCPPTGVNYALDATGVPKVVENMVDCLGTRGRASSIGAPTPGIRAGLDIFTHLVMGKEYVGCCEGDVVPNKIIPYLIEEHRKGNFPLDKLIKYYDMKDYQKAFDDTKHGKTIKAVLRWS